MFKSKRGDKRGWIRIVEAVIALLLILGVLLFVINKGYFRSEGSISSKVYGDQIAILRGIELNQDLRFEILNAKWPTEENQLSWNGIPQIVKDKIISTTPAYLNCTAKLCELDKICILSDAETPTKVGNIYSQAVAIAAEQNIYQPRQLKLFCWNA